MIRNFFEGSVRGIGLGPVLAGPSPHCMTNPFRCFQTSPEIIRLAVMMSVRLPLSLQQVEDLLREREIDICHETLSS